MTEFAQTIRGKTAQEIAAGINNDTVADFASNTYLAIMSGADSVLGAKTMGKAFTFAMGAGAASSRAKELYEQGASNVQIARGAIASGVAEALFEYVSLDHLIKTGASSTVKEFVANLIKQSGIEASEEVSTEIANKIIDAANRGYQSDHSQAVQAYREAGETEENARKLAWRDDVVDILWAGYGGAVAGGFSAGAYGGVNLMQETTRRIDMCKSVGQEFLQEDQNGGNRLEEAMSIGLTNAKGTEGYAMAQEIAAKLERGKTPTAYQLGRMLLESTSVQAMRARTIEGTILDSARQLGVDEKTAESVSALMVRADRAAVFVAPETLQTVGKDGSGQYSILRDKNGLVYVKADESVIPDGATDKDIPPILSNIIKNKFHNLINVNGQIIRINATTNKEWRRSKDAWSLRAEDTTAYADKLQILNNADEILQAAKSWIGEEPKHESGKGFVEFARGRVNFVVGQNGYSADVVVGIKSDGEAYLYDLVNINGVKIEEAPRNRSTTDGDTAVRFGTSSNNTIPQNGDGVNTKSMQNSEKDAPVYQAYGRYRADGVVELSANITTEEALEFVVKHELTHAIEGSEAYGKLQQLVRKSMGEAAYTAAVEQAQQERSDRGDTQGARNPDAEVVADWIAGNLYKDGFARIIRNMDGGAAVRFRAVLDNIQRALGLTKNFRQAAAIRSAERAFAEVLQSDYSRAENETAAETGDGQLSYMNDRTFKENIEEIYNMTDTEALQRREEGQYITVLEHTPEVILDNVAGAVDRKIIIRFDAAYLATRHNGALQGHYHNYGEGIAEVLPEVLNNPEAILRMDNGRLNLMAIIQMPKGNTTVVSVELDTVKDINSKNDPYNLVVTMMPSKDNYIRNNIRNHCEKVEYMKDDLPQVNPQLYEWLSTINGKSPSDTTVPQSVPGVNTQSMQNSENDSSNGQKSYLPADLQAKEEAAAAEKAENARRLAEEEGGDTEWEYDDEEMAGLLYEAMEKRRTKLQAAQREETERLTAQLQNGEITADDFNAAMERLRTEAVEDNDRKWRTGNRGTAQQREQIRQVRREARQEYGDKRDAAERSRMSAADRESIGKMLDSLESMLEHPDKNRHVPVEAIEAVRDLLLVVREDPVDIQRQINELVGKLQETSDSRQILRLQKRIDERRARLEKTVRLTEAMVKVEKTYRDIAGTGFDGKAKESPFQRYIEEVKEILEDKKLSDLNAGELHVVAELMKAIHGQLRDMNRLHSKAFKEGAHETGMRMAQEMTDAKGYTNETMRNLMLWQLTPGRFFEAICGWKQDSVGAKIAAELNEAQRKALEIRRAYHQLFGKLTNGENAANYARLTSTKEEDLVDIGLVDSEGKPMKMTRGLMMSLYESLCCQGNRRALMDAGMILPQLKIYYSGKEADAYVQGQKLSLSALSEEIFRVLEKSKEHTPRSKEYADLQLQYLALVERANQDLDQLQRRIEEEMTDYEMELHKAIRQWFDVDSKRMLNEVTTQLWNYEAARVKDYFPIYRSKDFVATAMESIISDRTLASSGNLKARVRKSKVPVHIADITSVLQTSMEKTAQFCGFAAFQEDFTRIYNATSYDMNTSFKQALGRKWGKGKAAVGVTGDQYIQNLMADISGGREGGSSFLGFFRRNAVRATLTMNLRVAVSQAASLPTAAAEIGWQYTAKALQHLPKVNQKTMDRIAQYSAYFFERYRGAGGMEEFSAAKEGSNALDKGYRWLDKATKGKLLNWCQEVDVRTVAIQWFGCEEAIKDTRPELKPGSDEYYKAVGEMLDRIIIKTQPNFTTAQRSDLLRSKNEALKFLTMYKTQANQNMNILYEVTGRLRAAKKSGDEAQIKAAKNGMVNGYTAVLVGTMVFALMRALVNLLQHREKGYRDKDGEVTGAQMAGAIGQEMLSGVAGMFTFGDIIYEVVSARVFGDYYFGVSDAALGNISTLLDDVATGNLKSGNVWYKVWKDTMNLLGIPWKNGADIVTGFWDHLTDIAHGELLSFNAHSGVETSAYYRQLLHAQQNGKTDKAAKLREFLLDSGKTENQIAAGMRSAMQEEADFEKREKRLLREAMESMLYKSMTEQEQKKVRSGISGYLADTMLEEQTGSSMTAAHQKAQRVIDKGLSPAAYYVGEAAKNGTTADRDGDGTVTRQEYRAMLSQSDYDQITQAVLLAQKRNTTKKKEE